MSTSPTEGGTTTGSNPAGVASSNHDQDTGSSARTELRSVSTDENRQEDAPLTIWCAGTGELCEVCRQHGGNCACEAGFEPITCPGCEGCADPLKALSVLADQERQARGQAASDPGNPVLEAADAFNAAQGEVPSQPEPRRCAHIIGGSFEDGSKEECGAVLGADLHCDVCGGASCYQHCAGVDHFKGQAVSSGFVGRLKWKIVLVAVGRLRGQLYRKVGEKLEILATVSGTNIDEVTGQLDQRARELEHMALTPPAVPAQTAVPFGVLDFVAKAPDRAAGKRAELLHEVIEWLRACDESWDAMLDAVQSPADGDALRMCRNLHRQMIAELFSRLAGAL